MQRGHNRGPNRATNLDSIEDLFDNALCRGDPKAREAGCSYIGLSTDGSSTTGTV